MSSSDFTSERFEASTVSAAEAALPSGHERATVSRPVPAWNILFWLLRLGIGLVFIVASAPKIASPTEFAQSIFRYQLLPDGWVQSVAITLPWLEIVAAASLIARPKWRCAGGLLIAMLLVVFSLAAASAWWRGLNISCGCFSSADGASPIGPWTFVRNATLLLGVLLLIWSDWKAIRHDRKLA